MANYIIIHNITGLPDPLIDIVLNANEADRYVEQMKPLCLTFKVSGI